MRPPGFIARLSPPFGRKSWSCTPRAGWRSVISPTFFSYGIFLPFWSVWLAGNGLTPETIGILLGAGLVARFLGSLLIAPRVSDPSRLIAALRVLALLTLLFALAFWAGSHVAWLLAIIIGFNLFFSPLVPLTDALANTPAKADHHGLWPGAAMGLYCLCDWFGADRQAGEPVRLPGDPADAKPGGRLDAARHAA